MDLANGNSMDPNERTRSGDGVANGWEKAPLNVLSLSLDKSFPQENGYHKNKREDVQEPVEP